jgi:hypothetical protein
MWSRGRSIYSIRTFRLVFASGWIDEGQWSV